MPDPAVPFLAGLDFHSNGDKESPTLPAGSQTGIGTSLLAGLGDETSSTKANPESRPKDPPGNPEGSRRPVFGVNYILIGNLPEDMEVASENYSHIEPGLLDAGGRSARVFYVAMEGMRMVKWSDNLATFPIENEDSEEELDEVRGKLRQHILGKLREYTANGMDDDRLEDAANLIVSDDLNDTLDGDEQEYGWRLETGRYEVDGWTGNWGEIPEDIEAYSGAFYLSVIRFTEEEKLNDQAYLLIERDADSGQWNVDLQQGVSEFNHEYFVGVWKKDVGNADDVEDKDEDAEDEAADEQCSADDTFEAGLDESEDEPDDEVRDEAEHVSRGHFQLASPSPTRHAPSPSMHSAQPVHLAVTAQTHKSTNWIALVIATGLTLAGLMYAWRTLIAPQASLRVVSAEETTTPTPIVPHDLQPDSETLAPQGPQKTTPETQVTQTATSLPSFDCAMASTSTEQTICRDAVLGELDRTLAEKYQRMRDAGIGGDILTTTQRLWVSTRNACSDKACLADAYLSRILALTEYEVGKTQAIATEAPPAPDQLMSVIQRGGSMQARCSRDGRVADGTCTLIGGRDKFTLMWPDASAYWFQWGPDGQTLIDVTGGGKDCCYQLKQDDRGLSITKEGVEMMRLW
jgi:uncharacterized protein